MNWKSVAKSALWIHSLIVVASLYVLWDGFDKVFRYKLFPYVIVSVILILSVAEWLRQIRGTIVRIRVEANQEPAGTTELPNNRYNRRVARFMGWLVFLIVMIKLIGPTVAIAVFMAAFLAIETKMSWLLKCTIVLVMIITTKYLFIGLLELTVPVGILEKYFW